MKNSQAEELLTLMRSVELRLARLEDILRTNGGRWFPSQPSIYRTGDEVTEELARVQGYRQEDHQNERIIPRYPKEGK